MFYIKTASGHFVKNITFAVFGVNHHEKPTVDSDTIDVLMMLNTGEISTVEDAKQYVEAYIEEQYQFYKEDFQGVLRLFHYSPRNWPTIPFLETTTSRSEAMTFSDMNSVMNFVLSLFPSVHHQSYFRPYGVDLYRESLQYFQNCISGMKVFNHKNLVDPSDYFDRLKRIALLLLTSGQPLIETSSSLKAFMKELILRYQKISVSCCLVIFSKHINIRDIAEMILLHGIKLSPFLSGYMRDHGITAIDNQYQFIVPTPKIDTYYIPKTLNSLEEASKRGRLNKADLHCFLCTDFNSAVLFKMIVPERECQVIDISEIL